MNDLYEIILPSQIFKQFSVKIIIFSYSEEEVEVREKSLNFAD